MASLLGPSGVALHDPVELLNVSFIAPIAFVPILMFYELGGDLFDFQTASIPFVYVKLETLTLPRRPSLLEYGRIALTGSRLRTLVYAFGIVDVGEERFQGKIKEKNTCIGDCRYDQIGETLRLVDLTKVTFGHQVYLFFYKNSVMPLLFFFEHEINGFVFRGLTSNTDLLLYFVNVSSPHLTATQNEVKLACLACDENWGRREHFTATQVFKYQDSRSFWIGLEQAAMRATSSGTALHWAQDTEDQFVWAQDYPCSAYRAFLNQGGLNEFGPVHLQFAFSLFLVDNVTAFIRDCNGVDEETLKKYAVRFNWFGDGHAMKISIWQPSETFDEAFMFITDQNVTSKRYAADLYLKAFDFESWIAVLVAGVVTCVALAMLVKTSKVMRMRSFRDSMRYLGAYFLDQCPSALPFPDAAVRSKKALLFIVVPWMMAILILSNGFRGVMKSNYVNKFPYETNLQNSNMTNFNLFSLVRNEDCNKAKIANFINEAWMWWEINGRQSKDWCYTYTEPQYTSSMTLLRFSDTSAEYRESRIDEWLNKKYVSYSWKERKITRDIRNHVALICSHNFSQYSGLDYQSNVDKWRKIAVKGPPYWNISFNYVNQVFDPCDSEVHYSFTQGDTEGENTIRAFWMTRKHESAWVIRKSEFAWYWNLFKKAMVNDSRVQYAHTGGAEVSRKTKRAIYERNDSPFYLFVRHRYMEPANWMIQRIAAIQESGIFNLWYKWDGILRPPVNESLNEEVSETFDEVRELRLSDPGITFLVNVALVLVLIAGAVFTVEVVLSMILM